MTRKRSNACWAAGRERGAAMRRARPGSVCSVTLLSAASTAWWWRRAWCRGGQAIGSRPTAVTRASSRGYWRVGCWSDLVDARIEQLERAIRETADQEPWRELVARLRCLRGIDTLTALALVTEIGDFGRFRSAAEFMAFVGLVAFGALQRRAAPPRVD